MYRYYSTMRPVSIGTFPNPDGNKVKNIQNFDFREYVESIDHKAWGFVEYEKPLTDKETADYELMPDKVEGKEV